MSFAMTGVIVPFCCGRMLIAPHDNDAQRATLRGCKPRNNKPQHIGRHEKHAPTNLGNDETRKQITKKAMALNIANVQQTDSASNDKTRQRQKQNKSKYLIRNPQLRKSESTTRQNERTNEYTNETASQQPTQR